MNFTTDGWRLTVIRDDGDVRLYTESMFLHTVKKALNARGFDFVKRLMSADGHMTGECQHYLKTRKGSKTPHVFLYDGKYAIRDITKHYNAVGYADLEITYDVYGAQGELECAKMFDAMFTDVESHRAGVGTYISYMEANK